MTLIRFQWRRRRPGHQVRGKAAASILLKSCAGLWIVADSLTTFAGGLQFNDIGDISTSQQGPPLAARFLSPAAKDADDESFPQADARLLRGLAKWPVLAGQS